MTATVVDVYAGPGGWSAGIRALGLTDIGIELDDAACLTRAAAGHLTIRTDVATMPLEPLVGRVVGLIMSPPCQSFSTAGNGEGRDLLDPLCQAVADGAWWTFDRAGGYGHVLEVGRWAETLRPAWIACEQVPPVLPVWRAYADRWRALGWSTWAGILNAADYGIPQTRRRAFLIARPDGRPVAPPEPTHCRGGALTMFGELRPWVSMADALGWGYDDRGSPAVTGGGSKTGGPEPFGHAARTALRRTLEVVRLNPGVTDTQPNRRLRPLDEPAPTVAFGHDSANWAWERPATTLVGDGRAFGPHAGSAGEPQSSNTIRLTIRDALILQGFPPDYPVQGTRTKQFEQVGNAVPPPLAAAVIAAVTGTHLQETAA